MPSIRLRGLTSESQFHSILKHVRSNSGPDVVFTSGVARVCHSGSCVEATITFRDTTSQSQVLNTLDGLRSGIVCTPDLDFQQLETDHTFLGITVLASPSTEDRLPVECVWDCQRQQSRTLHAGCSQLTIPVSSPSTDSWATQRTHGLIQTSQGHLMFGSAISYQDSSPGLG